MSQALALEAGPMKTNQLAEAGILRWAWYGFESSWVSNFLEFFKID